MIVTVTPNPGLDRTLTVPQLEFGEVLRASSVRLDWGGKGFNVSRALYDMGMDSVAMGFVGGYTGRMLEDGLMALGIETDFATVAGETRTNIVIRQEGTDRHLKVNEPGPYIHEEELSQFLDRAADRALAGDIWVLSGSLPPGVPDDFWAQLIALLKMAGTTVVLDSSGTPLTLGCAAAPTMVKPNALEASEALNIPIASRADAMKAARQFLDMGIETVVLTMGTEGVLLANAEEAVWGQPPQDVSAQNPTGAGDALLAGLIYAMSNDLSLEEMACWGAAAGTASAMTEGVRAGHLSQVRELAERVTTECLLDWEK
jgi:1-phosphofructokinase family hexose kinase